MTHSKFIHLRNHTVMSIGVGAISAQGMADFCIQNKMPAIAITDTNNLFGARAMSSALYEQGIQPILGLELTIADKEIKHNNSDNKKAYEIFGNIVLLSKNEKGYKNLLQLISKAYVENNDRTEPFVNLNELKEFSDNVIVLTGGKNSPFANFIKNNKIDNAYELLEEFNKIYNNNLYVEIERHGEDVENLIEPHLIDMAMKMNIPLVATNNAHFVSKDLFPAFDAFYCITQGTTVMVQDRKKLTDNHYLKTESEMIELFKDIPEAIENTINIAKRCGFYVEKQAVSLPFFSDDEEKVLIETSKQNLEKKLVNIQNEETKQVYRNRLEFELGIIIKMKFEGYFLIVADFINWAKQNDIPVGPGRGSGAGSLVAYVLGITNIDPIRFGLVFERFLNPERYSMPDFDVDFCQLKRDEVIEYVKNKYGADKVGHVIAFGKLMARQAVRDMGRVLGMPYSQIEVVSKSIPSRILDEKGDKIEVTLKEALKTSVELPEIINQSSQIKQVFDYALAMEGMYRNISKHASGIVISRQPLKQVVPLYKTPDSTLPVVGFDLATLEQAGLVKFDFLGLTNLTIINNTIKMIKQKEGIEIDIDKIPLDDEKVFKTIAKGDTTGIFQLEGSGMRNVVLQINPDKIEDIIAIISLFRPGPMNNIPDFVLRKKKPNLIKYEHPILEDILKETYGIIVYQEQVMMIVQKMAGFTLAQADLIRKAMGKKNKTDLEKHRMPFIEGSKNNGIDEKIANLLFDHMDKFAGYGFNKSHAAAYALISYQTAYLKTHYPAYFLASSMDLVSSDKLVFFVESAKNLGIDIELPSINLSGENFDVIKDSEGKYKIYYSLTSLKSMGVNIAEQIKLERLKNGNYTSVENFLKRTSSFGLGKRALEALILSGCFDSLDNNRKKLMTNVELLLSYMQKTNNDKKSNQIGLFGSVSGETKIDSIVLKDSDFYTDSEIASYEYIVFGFFAKGHPLDEYRDIYKIVSAKLSSDVMNMELYSDSKPKTVTMIGKLMAKKYTKTKSGKIIATLDFSDSGGNFSVVFFSEYLDRVKEITDNKDVVALLEVLVNKSGEDEVRLVGTKILDFFEDEVIPKTSSKKVVLDVKDVSVIDSIKTSIKNLKRGSNEIIVKVKHLGNEYKFKHNKKVKLTGRIIREMKQSGLDVFVEN